MSKLPSLIFTSSSLYSGVRNDRGELCNIYTPLQNLADEKTKKLGDFTTENLNFDMEHPVDIILQDSYDGAVNMIINDGKNKPRLVNSRFSVQDGNKFKIPDHSGFKDTNIYDEETFDVDTQLKAIPIKIPIVTYDGLINHGGKLHCGTYAFYFKLADADGNETEVIAESGIVQCHIGMPNSPNSIRMGLENENSSKAIKFTLTNIDAGFDYIHVLFSRTSASDDQAAATTYNKIIFNYPVDKDGKCDITITGEETIIGISKEECNVDYADINSVNTQTVNNNVLLFGNIDTPEHNWDEIKRFTWKIIPRWRQAEEGAIGSLDFNYIETSITKDQIEDHGYGYYNTKNVYYRLGYWPDEIYRFGIVYIFEDNSLSPVINLQGIDFNLTSGIDDTYGNDGTTSYEKIFFSEINEGSRPEYLYEEDGLYFNKKYRTNSRGVFKFPNVDVKNIHGGILSPRPLYINFDLSLIGYKYASTNSENIEWQDVLKKHNIKGFFFVRQKRIPTILGQGLVIGLTAKDCGALPVIKNDSGKFIVQPFINNDRLLTEEANEIEIAPGEMLDKWQTKEPIFTNQALLCPDAEVDEATFNQLFVSNEFQLYKNGQQVFSYDSNTHTSNAESITNISDNKTYSTKLTNVPEDTKILTNGTDFFSTIAGNPSEPYKTVDILHSWKWTFPQDLTTSTSLLRGKWGPFVGMGNPNYDSSSNEYKKCPFNYGDIFNIKTSNYANEEQAIELDFWKVMNSNSNFFAISPRTEMTQNVDCFRGDCYISMFTHRMFRNFIDPELPTNTQIVDPACWRKNYVVRNTTEILIGTHSNLTPDTQGFYIEDNPYVRAEQEARTQSLIYFLTLNFIGGIIWTIKANRYQQEVERWEYNGKSIKSLYPNGMSNEIVQAFEVYNSNTVSSSPIDDEKYITGGVPTMGGGKAYWENITDNETQNLKRKVNPKSQEQSGGILKQIFTSSDNWDLRGLASINRADVNAVAMGQWITFPILSNKNLAMRDVDFSNATEEAAFNRKRSFFPLSAKQRNNPLRDSNVINKAAAISTPNKPYIQLPKVPYFKQEYFTRIQNSLRDSSNSVTNEFKIMLESAYHDYTKAYGSITKLESIGNYVFIIFQHGIGILDMAQAISQAQDATYFLPEVSIISYTYGSLWKDSVIQTPSGIYGIDSVAKVIWRIQGTEVKIISDMKVEKFLIDNLDMSEFDFKPYIGHINIKSHYNAFKHDVIFTYYNDFVYEFPAQYSADKGFSIDLEGFVIDSSGSRTYTDESGKSVLYGKATRLLPYYDTEQHKWLSYAEILQDKQYQWVKGTNWSLCWNEDLQSFQTFYDWIPVESENIDNIYFSFDKDGIDAQKINTKDNILIPEFWSNPNGGISPKKYNISVGVKHKKNIIDSAFTNETKVYYIKKQYIKFNANSSGIITKFNKKYYISPSEEAVFSFYVKVPEIDQYTINISIAGQKIIKNIESSDWVFIPVFIKNYSENISFKINDIQVSVSSESSTDITYLVCEPKLMKYDDGEIIYSHDNTIQVQCYPTYKENGLFKQFYNIRTTDNSMKLWKHGQSGVYDNQGKIKPTNWYGKQHEFNFEFIVNENSSIQKIFNNLKIISNKAEPYKFEYEIVGEAYLWYEYKEIVHWINQKVKDGVFVDLDTAYKYVLGNTLGTIRLAYQDFPELFNKDETTYMIPKLPYLKIKLSDKKGIPDKDKSYTTHTTKIDNWSSVDKAVGINDYKLNTVETVIVEDQQLNEYRIHTEQYGNNMKKYGRIRGNMEYLEDLWDIEIRPISFIWAYMEDDELKKSNPVEARLRDKYIKIKVRYTGEDLVIIQAIQTMFDYSFA